ncbi:Exocyst complex component EXO70H1 [Sesamum angolense]|uniref:Exocyst subunit Exo70 family protein n=1 Tax=Sesamum angolense TaxID=2727404 RepID=A0AAE1WMX3_9LAMI|nr:Exocyst complex component EXO70H1 [Sesamum angolense]
MPGKGVTSFCFSPKASSSTHSHSLSRFAFSPSQPSLSETLMDRNLATAEPTIMKWDPQSTTVGRITSLFHHNRREARDFIQAVNSLQKTMHLLLTDNSTSSKLAAPKTLMQIAMKRLEKEFYQILSMNRAHLDPESVSTRSLRTSSTGSSTSDYEEDDDDCVRVANEMISEVEDASTLAMEDLRLIAECMVSSGYAKECMKVYKIIRKSIVDEGIYRLEVEKYTSSQIHKMDWQVLELRIQSWRNALTTAVKTLFNGERILCDHVFASSDSIRESCFTEITKEGAMILFGFPENVAKNSKRSPDKVFRLLDMYSGISDHWLEIDSIFSFQLTITIKSQALTSLIKLGEFVHAALNDFESAVLKDSTKSPVLGGGIHHLTTEVMNYLSILADYSNILSDILADSPPPAKHSFPYSYLGFPDSDASPAPPVSLKMAWLILALLCKLDAKANYYNDVSLRYLFLANNLQYVVAKVQTSNLKHLLGAGWLAKHESTVKQFAANYERHGWGDVIDSIPSNLTAADTPVKIKEIFKKFNTSFNQAYKKQSLCVVPHRKLRDDIKASIARKIEPLYRQFYSSHRLTMRRARNSVSVVRFAPEDVGHHISVMFSGTEE